MLLPGGGGCPAYDVLVEDLPFDFLQPPMQKQVTQAGYGGPYVIRNNPIGAIWDAIRGFCFPVPMQASSDGNQYTDLSGGGLDSGAYPVTDAGGLGGAYYPGYGGSTTAQDNCLNMGGSYNNATMVCVPASTAPPVSPTTTPNTIGGTGAPCDFLTQYPLLYGQAAAAWAARDVKTLCQIQPIIGGCAQGASVPGEVAKWNQFVGTIQSWIMQLGCDNCATCAGNNPASMKSGAMGSNPVGYQSGMGGNFNRIGTLTTPANGGMMGGITNPPFTPGTGAPYPSGLGGGGRAPQTLTGQGLAADVDKYFPRLPRMPSPMDMTEGNLGMLPQSEPMGGSFDPGSIGQGGTFSQARGNIGSLGRQRFR